MTTCYLDIAIIARPEDTYHIIGKVYRAIHGIITDKCPGRVGVAFPDWTDHEFDGEGKVVRRGALGRTIRLFGEAGDLEAIGREPALERFEKIRAVRLYPVQEVPETNRHVRFIRDRKREKATKGFRERRERRRRRRGGRPVKNQPGFATEPCTTHFITLTSRTNGCRYSLIIRREFSEAQSGSYSRYGLSKNGVTLPDF